MAHLQDDFMDKLENVIQEKWEKETEVLEEENRAFLKSVKTSDLDDAMDPIVKRLEPRWQKWRGKSGEPKKKERPSRTMITLKMGRISDSILVGGMIRQCRVRVEKSDNDLMVLCDGFHYKKPALAVFVSCCSALLAIPIALLIFVLFFAPIPLTGVLDQRLWEVLLFLGFTVSFVLTDIRASSSRLATLDDYIGYCIRETVKLFELKGRMQRQPP